MNELRSIAELFSQTPPVRAVPSAQNGNLMQSSGDVARITIDSGLYAALGEALGLRIESSASSADAEGLARIDVLAPRTAEHIEQLLRAVASARSASLLDMIHGAISQLQSLPELQKGAREETERFLKLVEGLREAAPEADASKTEFSNFVEAHLQSVEKSSYEAHRALTRLVEAPQLPALNGAVDRVQYELLQYLEAGISQKDVGLLIPSPLAREIASIKQSAAVVLRALDSLKEQLAQIEVDASGAGDLLRSLERIGQAFNDAENNQPPADDLPAAIRNLASRENLTGIELKSFRSSLDILRNVLEDSIARGASFENEQQQALRPAPAEAARIPPVDEKHSVLRLELRHFTESLHDFRSSLKYVVELGTQLELLQNSSLDSGEKKAALGEQLQRMLHLTRERESELAKRDAPESPRRLVLTEFIRELELLRDSLSVGRQRGAAPEPIFQRGATFTTAARELLAVTDELIERLQKPFPDSQGIQEIIDTAKYQVRIVLERSPANAARPLRAALHSLLAQFEMQTKPLSQSGSERAPEIPQTNAAFREAGLDLLSRLEPLLSPQPKTTGEQIVRQTFLLLQQMLQSGAGPSSSFSPEQLRRLAEKLTELQQITAQFSSTTGPSGSSPVERNGLLLSLKQSEYRSLLDLVSKLQRHPLVAQTSATPAWGASGAISTAQTPAAGSPPRMLTALEELVSRLEEGGFKQEAAKISHLAAELSRSSTATVSGPQYSRVVSDSVSSVLTSVSNNALRGSGAPPAIEQSIRAVLKEAGLAPASASPGAAAAAGETVSRPDAVPVPRPPLPAASPSAVALQHSVVSAEVVAAARERIAAGRSSIWGELERLVRAARQAPAAAADRHTETKLAPAVEQLIADAESRSAANDAGEKFELVRKLVEAFDAGRVEQGQQSGREKVQQVLTQLEQVFRGQQFLSRLSPVMQSLGEPGFLLFPFLAQGLISKLEMALFPAYSGARQSEAKAPKRPRRRSAENEREREDGERREEAPTRLIKFNLALPQMGEVGVEFAYTLRRAFVQVSTPSADIKEFLNGRAGQLESLLSAAGFDLVSCSVQQRAVTSVRPPWLAELMGEEVTVA